MLRSIEQVGVVVVVKVDVAAVGVIVEVVSVLGVVHDRSGSGRRRSSSASR